MDSYIEDTWTNIKNGKIIMDKPIFYIAGSQTLPPPLEGKEEEEMLKLLDKGDDEARKILVERNLRLVVYISRKFENTGIDMEDLISIGTIGLIKAVNTFKILDILYTPEPKKGADSLALSIVKEYIPETVEIKQRHFPMSADGVEKMAAWDKAAEEIKADVKAGKNVGFITLGDPMIYSTYVYVMERLLDEIEVETIPGISSFSNIASNQNFPLVMDTDPLIVIQCTMEEEKIDAALQSYDCLVLMKVYKNFKEIVQKLEKNGTLHSFYRK